MGPLVYPSEPGTRSLTGDCEVTSHEIGHTCRTPEAAQAALAELVAAGQGGSDAALALRWQIALALEPFVAQRARRVARRDPEGAADLTQTALAELAAAAHTWDPSLGALTTWGQWRLRPILDRAAGVQLGEATPRVGPAYYQAARQVDGLRSLGDSLESACATAGISPAAYQAARDAARPAVRLDAPVPGGEEGGARQIDRLADGSDPEAAILAGLDRRAVLELLEELGPRTQQILRDHLGGQTYARIAAELGLSRERVRQIVLATIRQLRTRLGIVPPARERQQTGAREAARKRRARTSARAEALTGDPDAPRERCWIVDAGAACTRRVDRRGLCESHAQIAARHGRLEQLSRPRLDGQLPAPRGPALWRAEGGALGGRVSAAQRRAKAAARIATWIPDPEAPRRRCWLIDAGVACQAPVNRRGLCARHSRALDRAGPGALDRLSRPPEERGSPRKSSESAGTTRPSPAAPPSSPGEGQASERSAAPVEAQAAPPAVAVAGSEGAGRGLPVQEPLAESVAPAGGQPTSTPEPQEISMARPAAPPPIDPSTPGGRCRLQDLDNLDTLIRAALDAERSCVNDLREALAEIVDRDLGGQTDADLIAAATSEVQRLREGWRWAAEDGRQTAQALDVARGQIAALEKSEREGDAAAEELARALGTYGLPLLEVASRATREIQRLREQAEAVTRAALESPESLERRYQALQSARRLRDLLEGRGETRVQLPTGETVGLQELWLWDLLSPLIPGEIERLEREAGVSRG